MSLLRWGLVSFVAAAILSMASGAAAAPYPGTGEAEAKRSARATALDRAKRAALEAAIEGIEVEKDAAAVRAVLDRHQAWTGAYRIIEEKTAGQWSSVSIEVDVDLARLRKRVAKPVGVEGRGYRLGQVTTRGSCTEEDSRAVLVPLEGAGVVNDSATATLDLFVHCESLGSVTMTQLQAARVHVEAKPARQTRVAADGAGFAASQSEARSVASERAGVELAASLSSRLEVNVVLVVREPWPAARVRRLEAAISDSVIGVRRARLSGVEADGSVRLDVLGNIDAAQLASGLATLSFPDFTVADVHVDSSHELTIRID